MQKILFLLPLILALLVSGTVEAKKKKYPNGDYYEGEWKKGQPDGFGKMIYANGNVYEGNWENGLPNGEGKMTYKGGGIYEGNWYLGIISGHGKMTYKSGSVYQGMWESGKRWREGKMIYSTGSTYDGHWEADIRKGLGELYSNGNSYSGHWNGDKFVGTGVLFKKNVSLNGMFSQDLKIFSGKCNIISPNGKVYATINGDVEISDDDYKKRNNIIYSTAKYEGDIHNFQREGDGIMSFNLYKTKITGEWKEDDFLQGYASLIYDSETFDFTIQKQNSIIYAINVQNRSTPIANLTKALSFKTHNIDSIPQQLFEVIAPTINNRRLKKAQEIKQEQNRQRQEYIAQKTNSFNIYSYLWSVSDINRLKQHNIAKFSQVLKGEKVLLYGTIADFFTGEGDNTAAAYWSNGLLPSTYTQYFIQLQGGIIIQAHSNEIANFSRGETIYIIADLRKDEYRGYVFDARYEIITTSSSEMKKELCKPLGNGVQPKLEYEDLKLVKNIYR